MVKSFIASVIDAVVGPFGFDVYISATVGNRGIDRFWIVRRAAGKPRPKRLRPYV